MIADGLVSASRLGARIHIKRCSDTVRFRVDVGGAVVHVQTNHLLDALARIVDTSRVTISKGARIKLTKHTKRWGGPNRSELAKRIHELKLSSRDPLTLGELMHEGMLGSHRYNSFVVTGRWSASSPNLQNIPIARTSQRT